MPEMMFRVRWPDQTETENYSPSLVIKDHFTIGEDLAPAEFLARARAALTIASDRVQQKYGFPCTRARATLAALEQRAAGFNTESESQPARMTITGFST